MTAYIAEFVGTALLILLGCGVVANVNLSDMLPPLNNRLKWGLLSQGTYRFQYL